MNILAIILLIFCGGLFLTIRSMKSLLTESSNIDKANHPNKAAQPNLTPPLIIESTSAIKEKISEIISSQKAGNLGDTVIEKIFIDNSIIYAVYLTNHTNIWGSELPNGFVVIENKLHSADSDILAHQYILRHKYADVFYLSKRSVLRKPKEYITSGIDQLHWEAFIYRKHTSTPDITTGDRIFNQIASDMVSRERRTTS
jgi:hypothetical protein